MAQPSSTRKGPLLLGIALGLLVFAGGLALATAFLPEWKTGQPLESKAFFQDRYRELAARAGVSPEPGKPRMYLSTSNRLAYGELQAANGHPWATRAAVRAEVFQSARGPRGWERGYFGIDFSRSGQPEFLIWWKKSDPFELPDPAQATRFALQLAPLVLRPGESLGGSRQDLFGNYPRLRIEIRGSSPEEHLLVMASSAISVIRMPGPVEAGDLSGTQMVVGRIFSGALGKVPAILLVAGLFVILALKSRLGVLNGALLALLTLMTLRPVPDNFLGFWAWSTAVTAGIGLWIFALWSCAESLLRSTTAEFTTSLDALRAGRLGPRGGRSLLAGFAFGAATAGLRLALLSLLEALPEVRPVLPTIHLPLFSAYSSPVALGLEMAGGVALALALALRVLPLRWAPVAASVVAGALFYPVEGRPFTAGLAASALLCGLLVHVLRRYGLTALLTAALVSALLPAAAYAVRYPEWMPGSATATLLPLAAIAALGWIGLSRSAVREVERLGTPVFVRRLEEERRLRNEMDLLARMQKGLLPRTLPRLDGYEIAARSILANEAGGDLYDMLSDEDGRFWLAAGDVAGHGYSCAIAQAMTKAALGSLIGKGRTPAQVLQRMDRVLRAAGAKRNFTSLALIRLDPATGEAVLSNAGHPYPLLSGSGEVRELAISGLPLGQGPARTYQDLSFRLEPGASLVLCSDGLFEAQDSDSSMYGFERAQTVLRVASGWSAGRILEAVFADWSHYLRAAQPLDDTTVVVLKRTAGVPAS